MSAIYSPIVTNIPELRRHFESYAEEHSEIKEFVYGDNQKILNLDRSEICYPVLWLETPIISYNFGVNFQKIYNCAFVVMGNAKPDNWQDVERMADLTESITQDLIFYLKEDYESSLLKLQNPSRVSADYVRPFGHDHDIGWRVSFQIRAMSYHSLDPKKRTRTCPIGTLPKFKFDNQTAGGFTNLVITNNTLPTGAGFEWEWTYEIDGGGKVLSQEETPTISASGNWIFIQLKITKDECTRYASAYIDNSKWIGESVPYIVET